MGQIYPKGSTSTNNIYNVTTAGILSKSLPKEKKEDTKQP